MKILVLGAGALGGYYGGRLVEAGGDVTFLVRERRAAQLDQHGLVVESPQGAMRLKVRTIAADAPGGFDVILLSCKSYDLPAAIAVIAPYAGGAVVVPLLNGLAHLDAMRAGLKRAVVCGGACYIGATMDPEGVITHFDKRNEIEFGTLDARPEPRLDALASLFAKTPVEVRVRPAIVQDMWNKFVFLATLAAMTTLMQGNVGEIVATEDGRELMMRTQRECESIAMAAGHRPPHNFLDQAQANLTRAGSSFASSMLRDLRRNGPTEAEHILGDMVRRARQANVDAVLLRAAWAHMQVYEAARSA